jgi:flagellar basal-body rod protein FlgF
VLGRCSVFGWRCEIEATRTLQSGAIERSNVKPVIEMTRLIEVNRSYQSVTSTVGRMDELRRSAIRQLADANV